MAFPISICFPLLLLLFKCCVNIIHEISKHLPRSFGCLNCEGNQGPRWKMIMCSQCMVKQRCTLVCWEYLSQFHCLLERKIQCREQTKPLRYHSHLKLCVNESPFGVQLDWFQTYIKRTTKIWFFQMMRSIIPLLRISLLLANQDEYLLMRKSLLFTNFPTLKLFSTAIRTVPSSELLKWLYLWWAHNSIVSLNQILIIARYLASVHCTARFSVSLRDDLTMKCMGLLL